MKDRGGIDLKHIGRVERKPAQHPRAVESPLPRGSGGAPVRAESDAAARELAPAPGRTQASPPASPPASAAWDHEPRSNIHRAVNAVRAVFPFVQRILPLLDGNIVMAVGNVLTSLPASKAAAAQPLNLVPLEGSVAELQTQNRELRDQVAEQNTSLKRLEDQLEIVREAADRNTREQRELMEDLRAVGKKVNWIGFAALALLLISVILNVILYLHLQNLLP